MSLRLLGYPVGGKSKHRRRPAARELRPDVVEALEQRTMLAIITGIAITATGTADADQFVLRHFSPINDLVQLTVNGANAYLGSLVGVSSIEVNGLGGNDTLTV